MSIVQATSDSVQAQERLVYELKQSKETANGMIVYYLKFWDQHH